MEEPDACPLCGDALRVFVRDAEDVEEGGGGLDRMYVCSSAGTRHAPWGFTGRLRARVLEHAPF